MRCVLPSSNYRAWNPSKLWGYTCVYIRYIYIYTEYGDNGIYITIVVIKEYMIEK